MARQMNVGAASSSLTAGAPLIDFVSKATGRDYRLLVWRPPIPPPAGGFPVLWVLDGSGYFGLAVDMVRNRSLVGVEIAASVVVGVTYPTDDMAVGLTRRYLDFTATPSGAERFAGGQPTGDVEGFLDTIEHEAVATLEERFSIDRARMAIFGHSLGGHAVLHALLTRPEMFQSYLAISPSIWWHGRELLSHEPAFIEQLGSLRIAPRLFIAVGALEETPLRPRPGMEHIDLSRANEMIAEAKMIDTAAALAKRLRDARSAPGFAVEYACLPDETHVSVPFAAARAALDFALPFKGFT